jgi:carbonic anhydrase
LRELFVKKNLITLAFLLFATAGVAYNNASISPQEALSRLTVGNQRYVNDELEHPDRTSERREASQTTQTPFAVIVGCSDSRVSPEIIFDQGIGDLFVVRVAGNVIGPLELESIEYSTFVLNSVLVLVLGHENCGAVKAVLQGKSQDFPALTLSIGPAVKEVKGKDSSDALTAAIKANALHMKDLLLRSGKLGKLAKKKLIDIEAAYYNLETGEVELL